MGGKRGGGLHPSSRWRVPRHGFRRAAEAPQIVADTRLLHLDHLGAELAEQRRADRRREIGREVEDANGVERAGGVGHGDHLTRTCYDPNGPGDDRESHAGARVG